jgi:hypothetical protein
MTMTKLQYLLRGGKELSCGELCARALDSVARSLLEDGPQRLKVTLTSADPPRLSVVPLSRERLALISLWDERDPVGAAARWTPRLAALAGRLRLEGYHVEEALPRAYARDWPDGAQTPGVGLLTLLRRRPGLSDMEFFRRWHDGHSPLALRVHPLWCYVRNVVARPVVDGTPPLCGIVEEQFRTPADLLDPVRLFGGPLRMIPNMARIGLDVRGFLDLGTLENYLVSEHWLRS